MMTPFPQKQSTINVGWIFLINGRKYDMKWRNINLFMFVITKKYFKIKKLLYQQCIQQYILAWNIYQKILSMVGTGGMNGIQK